MDLLNKYDYYIFDFDGTLVDSMEEWKKLYVDTFEHYNLVADQESLDIINALSIVDGAKYMVEKFNLPISADELLKNWRDNIKTCYQNTIHFKSGAIEYIKLLHNKGKKICIATATEKPLCLACLEANDMDKYFQNIITVDQVGIGKQSSKIFEVAIECMGGVKEKTILFEDSPIAIKTAINAKIATIQIIDKFAPIAIKGTICALENYDKIIG